MESSFKYLSSQQRHHDYLTSKLQATALGTLDLSIALNHFASLGNGGKYI